MIEQRIRVRVGKRRRLTIPKPIAERLGICEGSLMEIRVVGGEMRLKPIDAVWLSLHGEKIAETTLQELEEESLKEQLFHQDR